MVLLIHALRGLLVHAVLPRLFAQNYYRHRRGTWHLAHVRGGENEKTNK